MWQFKQTNIRCVLVSIVSPVVVLMVSEDSVNLVHFRPWFNVTLELFYLACTIIMQTAGQLNRKMTIWRVTMMIVIVIVTVIGMISCRNIYKRAAKMVNVSCLCCYSVDWNRGNGNMGHWKTGERKTWHKCMVLENAWPKNAEQIWGTGKCGNGKRGTDVRYWKMRERKMQDISTDMF